MIDAIPLGSLGAASPPHRRVRLVESLGRPGISVRRPGKTRSEVGGHRQRTQRLESRPPDFQSAVLPFAKHRVLVLRRQLRERAQPTSENESGERVLEQLQQLLDLLASGEIGRASCRERV